MEKVNKQRREIFAQCEIRKYDQIRNVYLCVKKRNTQNVASYYHIIKCEFIRTYWPAKFPKRIWILSSKIVYYGKIRHIPFWNLSLYVPQDARANYQKLTAGWAEVLHIVLKVSQGFFVIANLWEQSIIIPLH